MENKLKLLISQLGENRVKTDVDLSEYLHTGLGAKAEAFYIATTTRELIKTIEICKDLKLEFLVIGSGSKMAIPEDGFDGLAIKNRSDHLRIFGIKGKVSRAGLGIEEALIEAESGTSLNRLAEYSIQQGLGGFETFRGIVGTVGGSLRVNATLREKAHQVKVLTQDEETKTKAINSVTQTDIILSVIFKLKAKK